MRINIAHIEPESYIYAPEKQFVIWMQGCSIHCKGCWNTEMWSFNKKKLLEIDDIIAQIFKINNLKGVTFLGGEPFDQEKELLYFVEKLKKTKLGITIYTGYEQEKLNKNIEKEILKNTDLLISGKYIKELRNTNLQWIGSENQQLIYLSKFYKTNKNNNANYCEINISESGAITMLGFPDEDLIKTISQ